MDVLWPEADPEAAGANLSTSIHHSRQVLGAGALQVHDDLVALHGGELWVDVHAFEAAARSGDANAAGWRW